MSLFDRTSGPRERTPEERERARAEREARRAAREGRTPAPPPLSEAAPDPLDLVEAAPPPPPAPPAPAPEPLRPPEAAPAPQRARWEPVLHVQRPRRAQAAVPPAARAAAPEALASDGRSDQRGTGLSEPAHEDWSAVAAVPNGSGEGPVDGGEAPLDGGEGRRRWRPRLRPPRDPGPPRGADGRRRAPGGRRIAAGLAAIVVLAIAWLLTSLFQPLHGDGHGAVEVRIPSNVGLGKIGDTLARRDVISSSFFFSLRARLSGQSADLKPGLYTLKRDMSYGAAIDALVKGPVAAKTLDLTIPEGRSIPETDARLKAVKIPLVGSYAADARRSRLLDPRRYGAPKRTPSLEGFLFPSTYQVRVGAPVSTLVDKQLAAFKAQFAKVDLREAVRAKRMRPYDVVIIASMIEREVEVPRERPLVAAVIYNRIRQGIPLYIDSTTRYEHQNWTQPLTTSDFDRSAYDTRHHKDLPPTPIGNPGLASLNAAAHPAKVPYLYFVVKPGRCGEHAFSSSYSQFLKDQSRYNDARAIKGGGDPRRCP